MLLAQPHFVVVVVDFASWGFLDHGDSVNSNPSTCEDRLIAINFWVNVFWFPLSSKLNGSTPLTSLCHDGWDHRFTAEGLIFFLIYLFY